MDRRAASAGHRGSTHGSVSGWGGATLIGVRRGGAVGFTASVNPLYHDPQNLEPATLTLGLY